MEQIKIKKRDGRLEDYIYDKLLASITKAGVVIEDAESLAKEVESWLSEESKKGYVESVEVRNVVFNKMNSEFPAEADSYQAFKKS